MHVRLPRAKQGELLCKHQLSTRWTRSRSPLPYWQTSLSTSMTIPPFSMVSALFGKSTLTSTDAPLLVQHSTRVLSSLLDTIRDLNRYLSIEPTEEQPHPPPPHPQEEVNSTHLQPSSSSSIPPKPTRRRLPPTLRRLLLSS